MEICSLLVPSHYFLNWRRSTGGRMVGGQWFGWGGVLTNPHAPAGQHEVFGHQAVQATSTDMFLGWTSKCNVIRLGWKSPFHANEPPGFSTHCINRGKELCWKMRCKCVWGRGKVEHTCDTWIHILFFRLSNSLAMWVHDLRGRWVLRANWSFFWLSSLNINIFLRTTNVPFNGLTNSERGELQQRKVSESCNVLFRLKKLFIESNSWT